MENKQYINKQPYADALREQLDCKLENMNLIEPNGALRDKTLKIFVVEDNPMDKLAMEKAIEQVVGNYSITHFGNGYEIIKNFEESNGAEVVVPDLVILDLRTPKIGGETVLQYIRDHNHLAWIPVFVVAAREKKEAKIEMDDNTVFIKKPIDAKILGQALACFSNFWYIIGN